MNEVLRQEKKYLMNLPDSLSFSQRLGNVMILDEHSGALGYPVRSLYFDTLDDDDFNDKVDGLELRQKIRLRCYSPAADFAVLEMKQKSGAYQKKRSLRLKREDAERMTQGDYSPLLTYDDSFAKECYALMNYRCYRPRAIVEYCRQAFVTKENHIRITLDSKIVATESCFDIFSDKLCQYPVFDPFNVVLEVKYDGFLLSYIKELVSTVDRSEFSVSKYCLARSVSRHYVI